MSGPQSSKFGALGLHKLSIAIVGCGTAGLAAAAFLSQDGHDVVLFEKFDAPKPLEQVYCYNLQDWPVLPHWVLTNMPFNVGLLSTICMVEPTVIVKFLMFLMLIFIPAVLVSAFIAVHYFNCYSQKCSD